MLPNIRLSDYIDPSITTDKPPDTPNVLMLSAHKVEQIISALKNNSNACQVARQQGCGEGTVRRIAADQKIDLTAGKQLRGWLSNEMRATAVAELNMNPNVTAVAGKLGCSKVAIRKVAKDEGVALCTERAPKTPGITRQRLTLMSPRQN